MNTVLAYISKRMQEPSTYSGIAVLAGLLHFTLPEGSITYITDIGVGIGGLVAIFMKDPAHKEPTK